MSKSTKSPREHIGGWLKSVPFLSLHVACVAVFFTGVNSIALALCGVFYFVRMFGITAGYHRYFSHRSFKTSRPFQFVLAWLGCSAMQKGPLWWASHHRHHHRYSDTPEDPHSPRTNSVWWSHIGWVLARDHEATNWQVIRDWTRYPELRWLNRHHWIPGMFLATLCALIGGWSGLAWGFFVSTVLLYHAVFAVNSLCHIFGRRRFATTDESRNNAFVAVLTLGEGWHNNHHHYQSSANQGFFWWEIDVCYYMLKVLGFFGVVWGLRKPPAKVLRNESAIRKLTAEATTIRPAVPASAAS
ncbi:MAG TPA: acyl-CoA desaturase [Gemmataceae bacterium]|nr:acyl-CoA desaturase [Gemmataceae bacterium]